MVPQDWKKKLKDFSEAERQFNSLVQNPRTVLRGLHENVTRDLSNQRTARNGVTEPVITNPIQLPRTTLQGGVSLPFLYLS